MKQSIRLMKPVLFTFVFLATISGIGINTAYGQKVWEKKPYEQWNGTETGAVLLESWQRV